MKVGVIGAGAMGTAISQVLANNTEELLLFARREEICKSINERNINIEYFNVPLKKNIVATNDLHDLKNCKAIFLCIPSSAMREVTKKIKGVISDDCILVTTAKGMEHQTSMRMSEVIDEVLDNPVVVLSGPNIASEVVNEKFSATTIASYDKNAVEVVKDLLETSKFKVEICDDVVGVEFCGILKNILALSQGILKGMNININAKNVAFTKGFNEVKYLIEQFGGNPETVDKYCGFGDIITASVYDFSRNQTLGVLYGQGVNNPDESEGVLFEGSNTVGTIKKICDKLAIESIIVNFVFEVVVLKTNLDKSFIKLWDRL